MEFSARKSILKVTFQPRADAQTIIYLVMALYSKLLIYIFVAFALA